MPASRDHIRQLFADEILRRKIESSRQFYRSAASALEMEEKQLENEVKEFSSKVDAGEASWVTEAGPGHFNNEAEFFSERHDDIEDQKRLLREFVSVQLYHQWETHRQRHYGDDDARAISDLQGHGLTPDDDGLHTLRLTSNVAKHGKGSSARQLFQKKPSAFNSAAQGRSPSDVGYEQLLVTEADVETFFQTMRSFHT